MKRFIGEIYIWLSSILIAVSTVFTHLLTQKINPLLLAFYSVSFAFVISNLMQVNHTAELYSKIKKDWKILFMVNLSTAIDWLLIFVTLKYINGSLVNCIVFGVAPLGALFLTLKSYLSKKLIAKDIIVTLSICSILSILSYLYYEKSTQPLDKIYLLVSIALCVLSGFAASVTVIACKILHQKGFNPFAIMKTRYIFLIIISFALIVYLNINISISYSALLFSLLLALFFVFLPSFFLQKGLEKTSAVTAVIIGSSIPVITYLFQIIDPKYPLQPLELLLVTLLSFTIYFSIQLGARYENQMRLI